MPLKVSLKNFMGYEDAALELDGFTSIIGESSRGKSKVFRGLKTLLENRPVEDSVTWGETSCEITLDWPERGITVALRKNKSGQACYGIETPAGRREYKKLGRNIPDEVKALGLDRLELPNGHRVDLHFHSQHDPLLVSESSIVDVMYILSCAGELLKLDKAAKLCQQDQKELQAGITDVEAQSAGVKAGLAALEPLDRLAPKVAALVASAARIRTLEEAIPAIGEFRERQASLLSLRDRLAAQMAVLESADMEASEAALGMAVRRTAECRNIAARSRSRSALLHRISGLTERVEVIERGQLEALEPERAATLLGEIRRLRGSLAENRRLKATVARSGRLVEVLRRAALETLEKGALRSGILATECRRVRAARGSTLTLKAALARAPKVEKLGPAIVKSDKQLAQAGEKCVALKKLSATVLQARQLVATGQGLRTRIQTADDQIAVAEDELRQLCKELKECPICGNELDADYLVHGHSPRG